MSHSAEIFLILFILNLGIAFGAGIYETLIVLPKWFPRSPESGYRADVAAMHELDTGRKFWAFFTTIPLTLLTLANLFLAWQAVQPQRSWWLAAALITLVERLSTFGFFIPTIIKLQHSDPYSATTGPLITRWLGVNYGRCLLTLIAWLLALVALSV